MNGSSEKCSDYISNFILWHINYSVGLHEANNLTNLDLIKFFFSFLWTFDRIFQIIFLEENGKSARKTNQA